VAEDVVVKEQLTADMIEAGAEVTKALDNTGVPVSAAFWFFEPEINEWRLFFASPEVPTNGPRKFYERIQLALDQLASKGAAAPLSTIGLLDPNSELVQLLKAAIRTGPGINRIRFSKNAINGHFIEDALIYRVT
jgi:hypothetical protein